jgi:hypothetical protein
MGEFAGAAQGITADGVFLFERANPPRGGGAKPGACPGRSSSYRKDTIAP